MKSLIRPLDTVRVALTLFVALTWFTLGWRLCKLQPAPPALPHCDLAIGVRTGEQSIDYCFNRTDGRGHPVEMTEQDAKTLRENLPCPGTPEDQSKHIAEVHP